MAEYISMTCRHSSEPFESALAKPGDWAWQSWYGNSKKPDLVADEVPSPSVPVPDEDAKPCSKCGAWFLWCDAGGNRYCVECYPPPTILAVQKILQCVVVDGKRHAVDATIVCWPLWRERLKNKR